MPRAPVTPSGALPRDLGSARRRNLFPESGPPDISAPLERSRVAPDRKTWLAPRRASVRDDHPREGPTSAPGYGPAAETHRRFVVRLVETCPKDGTVLDVACASMPA